MLPKAQKIVNEQVEALVYAFPKLDLRQEVEHKGSAGHAIILEAKKLSDKAGITRAENLIMTACKQNNSKAKNRVGSVTAELTNRMKTDWHQCVFHLVAVMADAILRSGGTAEAPAAQQEKKDKKKASSSDQVGDQPKKKSKTK